MDNEPKLEDLYKKISDKYLPNGKEDLDAGVKELQIIFTEYIDASRGQKLLFKTLLKLSWGEVIENDIKIQEQLRTCQIYDTDEEQRERFVKYVFAVVDASKSNKSLRDIAYQNGNYIFVETPNFIQSIFGTTKNARKVAAGVGMTLIAMSGYNGYYSSPIPKNNLVGDKNNTQEVRSAGIFNNLITSEDIDEDSPPVKKSRTSICHPKGGTYYYKTQNFTPFATMEECLDSGGRRPKK